MADGEAPLVGRGRPSPVGFEELLSSFLVMSAALSHVPTVIDPEKANDPNVPCACADSPGEGEVCFKPGVLGLITSNSVAEPGPRAMERFCKFKTPMREPERFIPEMARLREAADGCSEDNPTYFDLIACIGASRKTNGV